MSAYNILHCSYILGKSQREEKVDTRMHPCTGLNPFQLTAFTTTAHHQLPRTRHNINEPYFQFMLFGLTWR